MTTSNGVLQTLVAPVSRETRGRLDGASEQGGQSDEPEFESFLSLSPPSAGEARKGAPGEDAAAASGGSDRTAGDASVLMLSLLGLGLPVGDAGGQSDVPVETRSGFEAPLPLSPALDLAAAIGLAQTPLRSGALEHGATSQDPGSGPAVKGEAGLPGHGLGDEALAIPGAAEGEAWQRASAIAGPGDALAGAPISGRLPSAEATSKVVVTVVAQETHFAPVAGPAPAELGSNSPSAAAASGEAGSTPVVAGDESSQTPLAALPPLNESKRARDSTEAKAREAQPAATPSLTGVGSLPAAPAGREEANDSGRERHAEREPTRDATARTESGTRLPDLPARLETGPSPGAQIARRVLAETTTLGSATGDGINTQPSAGKGSVLKVLHIDLEPASLGKVTVRLELKDDVLNVRLETAHRDASAAIEKDRDALASALKSAGYVIDGITLQTADPQRATGQATGANTPSTSLAFGEPQSGHAQSRGEERPQTARNDRVPDGPGLNETAQSRSLRGAGALYV